jgi:hypothetical protein
MNAPGHMTHFRGMPLKDLSRQELYDAIEYLDQMYNQCLKIMRQYHQPKSERNVYYG